MNEDSTAMNDRNLPPNHIKWMVAGLCVLAVIVTVALQSMNEHKVSLKSKIVQRGVYQQENCEPDADAHFNECLCDADIKGLVIAANSKKITKRIQKIIDDHTPETSAGSGAAQEEGDMWQTCRGTRLSTKAPEDSVISSESFKWVRVYESETVLTLTTQASSYAAGAAHGMFSEDGYTFNKITGELINPLTTANADTLKRANAYVQEQFNTVYKNDVFKEILVNTRPYLTNDACDGCDVYFVEGGWRVVFGLYSVGPYSTGMIDMLLPLDIFPKAETMIQST